MCPWCEDNLTAFGIWLFIAFFCSFKMLVKDLPTDEQTALRVYITVLKAHFILIMEIELAKGY